MMTIEYTNQGGYELSRICPLCREIYKLQLSDYERYQYENYIFSDGYIQEDMPTLNLVEREFILTGYCPECQKVIFGNGKTNRVTPLKQTSATRC